MHRPQQRIRSIPGWLLTVALVVTTGCGMASQAGSTDTGGSPPRTQANPGGVASAPQPAAPTNNTSSGSRTGRTVPPDLQTPGSYGGAYAGGSASGDTEDGARFARWVLDQDPAHEYVTDAIVRGDTTLGIKVPPQISRDQLDPLLAALTDGMAKAFPGQAVTVIAFYQSGDRLAEATYDPQTGQVAVDGQPAGARRPASTPPVGRSPAQPAPLPGAAASGRRVGPADAYPDPRLTPGDTLPGVSAQETCVSGYAKSVRNVSSEEKTAVYQRYGVQRTPGDHEVDHFIPLTLGGSNALTNLWPEPYDPRPGAHEKDQVEAYLHQQVCAGALSLEEAQRAITSDWVAVYQRIAR